MTGYFFHFQNYVEKSGLFRCSCYPKRNMGVTVHLSEIIKLQFGKVCHTLPCILKRFTILLINYLQKMRGYPQFSFWISITIVKICFSCIFSKPHKNTFELVGTVLNYGFSLSEGLTICLTQQIENNMSMNKSKQFCGLANSIH